MKVYNSLRGEMIDSHLMLAANRLIELSKIKPMWEVVDEIIRIWSELKPKEWKSHLINMANLRETRKNKFSSSYDKKTGNNLRYTLDVPEKVILMIRVLYGTDEAPMDKKWFNTFAKRYPKFVVAEKI